MKPSIYIAGSGQTRFGEWWDKSIGDLMQEAMTKTMESSPCTSLDIDMVIVANMLGELTNGQAQLGALAASFLPHRPPALRVEAACGSGSVAMHTAMSILESGRAENILVIGVEKMTDVSVDAISAGLMGAADAEKDIPSGLTFPGIFGLITKRYMHEYSLTRDDLNFVSARHHANAETNPFAQFRKAIAPEKISQSSMVADPLCMLDCSPVSDGAAAVLLSTKYKSPFKILASEMGTDALSISDRATITSFAATKEAVSKAWRVSNLSPKDIDHVELHDCFSTAAIINLEDLGFATPGRGIELYKDPPRHMTINASGGLKACGHPVAATGVKQVIDLTKKLSNEKTKYGLAQNFGGACATCAIHIIEHSPVS